MEGEQAGGKASKWLKHVKKTMKAHKGKTLKQVLKMAKKTYRGGSDVAPYQAASTTAPVGGEAGQTAGRRRSRSRRGRKGSRRH